MAGLFGGGRTPRVNWGDVGAWLTGGAEYVHENRNRQRAQAAGQQQAAQEDWLRAQLSPADGPGGSGTGAMPSIEQQMAALQEAQLRSPEVAAQFAPVVQARRLEGLIGGRPVNEQVATLLNPEKAGEAFATQFRDDTLAPGSIRTRGDQTIAAAPITQRFDDRFGTYDPITGETVYSQPRGTTYSEETERYQAQTGRITAERPQIANLSPGQESYGVDPYGRVTGLAANTNATPQQQQAAETLRSQIQGRQEIRRAYTDILGQLGYSIGSDGRATRRSGAGPAFRLSPGDALRYEAILSTGMGSQAAQREAAAYANYRSTIQAIVNDQLRLNTGPQTDQDAVREAEGILGNINNLEYVTARLPFLLGSNDRMTTQLEEALGRATSGGQQAPQSSGPRRITSQSEYNALPSGTEFIAPDGSRRRKP